MKINGELELSLQVVSVVAGERDEVSRQIYKQSLRDFLFSAAQEVFLDDTHKGRNAARRRRHWSRRNVTLILMERFTGISQQTVLGDRRACDWNGFIP